MLSFTGSKCYSLTKSGSTVTAGGTGVCSATVNGGSAFCLSASVNANGNLTLTNEGVCGFQDSATVTFTQPSPGIYSASVAYPEGQNLTECVSCRNGTFTVRDNVTLEVKRLCAEQQCEVRSDPPTDTPSPGGQWRPNYCIFGCGDGDGDNDDGSDGDGDDGGGFAVIPPILPPPLFPPLFPPILPVGPPGGGSTGSSSSPNGPPGGDPNSPGAVYPITTYLPPGADPPIVEGGTWVPIVNFSQAVPYCGADSSPSRLGSLVLDISVQPSQVYLCQVVANGSYAWMPYCPCQLGAANNRTYYYYNTTTLWRDNSTVLISNTSQLINTGATYLGGPVFIAGPIVLTSGSSMDTCNATTVRLGSVNGCNGEATSFLDGVRSFEDFALPVYNSTESGGYAPLLARVGDGLAHMYWDSGISAPIICTLQYNTCVPYKRQVLVASSDIQVSASSSGPNNNVQLYLNNPLPNLSATNLTVSDILIAPPTGDAQGVGITKDGANFCPWESPPNVTARFQRIGSCGPGPGDAALYVDSPLETNAGINNRLNGIINCGTSNNKLLSTNSIRNCDGVSPVDFPQGISIAGLPSPVFASQSVTGLYYVATLYSGLLCGSYTPMTLSFGFTLMRIGNAKFLYWDWPNTASDLPSSVTFTASTTCAGVIISTSASSVVPYLLPSSYRPSALLSPTAPAFERITTSPPRDEYSNTYALSLYTDGSIILSSDGSGFVGMPAGDTAFYMPSLTYT